MKYNLDKKIKLEAEPEHKGLYPWALQELAVDGTAGRDQIPWTLSHSFFATELALHAGYSVNSQYEKSRTWIRAKLSPSMGRNFGAPIYSMFGTDRPIQQIQLFVHRLDDSADMAGSFARASGWPSSTSNEPLFGSTEPDLLQFDLSLAREEFDQLAKRIVENQVDVATFHFHAYGFYSEWTPDIDTDTFKVLCAEGRQQAIIVSEGCAIDLPRLGEVWDATFAVERTATPRLVSEYLLEPDGNEKAENPEMPLSESIANENESPSGFGPFFAELKMIKSLLGLVAVILALGFLFT